MKEGKIFLPPCIDLPFENPAVFLNGPVYDSMDWQEEAINIFKKSIPWANIVSPRRKNNSEFFLCNDRDWRRHYLEEVAKNGVVLFWFPNNEISKDVDLISVFQLGEQEMRHMRGKTRIVVGIHPDFPYGKYLGEEVYKNISNLIIWPSLEDVCKDAIEYLRSL